MPTLRLLFSRQYKEPQTIVLAAATGFYAWRTHDISTATRDQADATVRLAEATRKQADAAQKQAEASAAMAQAMYEQNFPRANSRGPS
jgi:hypothetical protein